MKTTYLVKLLPSEEVAMTCLTFEAAQEHAKELSKRGTPTGVWTKRPIGRMYFQTPSPYQWVNGRRKRGDNW